MGRALYPTEDRGLRVHEGGLERRWFVDSPPLQQSEPATPPPISGQPHPPPLPLTQTRPSKTKQRGDEGVRSDPQRWGAWGAEGTPCGGGQEPIEPLRPRQDRLDVHIRTQVPVQQAAIVQSGRKVGARHRLWCVVDQQTRRERQSDALDQATGAELERLG